ncbi:hypothetical protein [Sphingopyxis sp. PET50]|uniref:hypothetical protein n=1 Tax=Sphingopyxis sp. PET50 TaxID=2976533 RepID=UPI0021B01521|nr:hypothetical protein [Sphingopyxis sp. PET50]
MIRAPSETSCRGALPLGLGAGLVHGSRHGQTLAARQPRYVQNRLGPLPLQLMLGMALVSTLAVIGALLYLHFSLPHGLTIHMIIATAAGVGLSVMLGAALMGLVFLSSGSGHDESIEDPFENDPDMNHDR